MDAYDNLLTAVQFLVSNTYHQDRHELDQLYRGSNYEFPPDEVHDRIVLAVKALVQEIENRFNHLAVLEMSEQPTASNHMRSLVWALAAHELRVYAEGDFSFESIETRVPQEVPADIPADIPEGKYQKVAEAIVEHFTSPRSTIAPHFMYDASTGTVVSLYSPSAEKGSDSDSEILTRTLGHTKWVSTSTPQEREYHRRVMEFANNLYTHRIDRGIKRGKMADVLGVTKQDVKLMEFGDSQGIGGEPLNRDHPFVIRAAEYFQVSPFRLWPWVD